ncbi:MAG: sulfite exporter TauE/SafE family protein [Cyclobacteriaceae bacterium]|nr:sulfite exporter TauE/SafE family protein [Cyclobacteriaceae bacterium]
MIENTELIIIFFLVALFYSTVGFGGGSSYLALMAVFGISALLMRSTALTCNIIVVTSGTYLFYRQGHLNFKKVWPFVLASIPMAFAGGLVQMSEKGFMMLLGSSLILAALLMVIEVLRKQILMKIRVNSLSPLVNGGIGGAVGFLSGLVGIGGGIFLSPLLHLTQWGTPREIAALSSFFILVNSMAGLSGLFISSGLSVDPAFVLPLVVSVFAGGQIGSRLGSKVFRPDVVKLLTALLIFYVGLRIVLLQGFGVRI